MLKAVDMHIQINPTNIQISWLHDDIRGKNHIFLHLYYYVIRLVIMQCDSLEE